MPHAPLHAATARLLVVRQRYPAPPPVQVLAPDGTLRTLRLAGPYGLLAAAAHARPQD